MVLRPYFYIAMYKLDASVIKRETHKTIEKGYHEHLNLPIGKYWVCLDVAHLDSEHPLPQHARFAYENDESSPCHVEFKHEETTKFIFIANKGAGESSYRHEFDFFNHLTSDSLVIWKDFEVKQGANEHLVIIPELKVVAKSDANPTGINVTLSNLNVTFKVNGLPL